MGRLTVSGLRVWVQGFGLGLGLEVGFSVRRVAAGSVSFETRIPKPYSLTPKPQTQTTCSFVRAHFPRKW